VVLVENLSLQDGVLDEGGMEGDCVEERGLSGSCWTPNGG